MVRHIGRRHALLAGTAALSTLALPKASRAAKAPGMTLYRDPHCGCCMVWVEIVRKTYAVDVVETHEMQAIKQKLGVPSDLTSCHTGVIDAYVVEGHVPVADIQRLLKERPDGVKGLAVPGMPLGSPGMEVPDGTKDAFDTFAFTNAGGLYSFAKHNS